MSAGDVEVSLLCLIFYANTQFIAGEDVNAMKNKMELFLKRSIQHKHEQVAKRFSILYSMTLQLLDQQENCYSTYFQCPEDHVLLDNSTRQLHYYRQIFMSVYYHDMCAAAHWTRERQRHQHSIGMLPCSVPIIYAEFLHGLVAWHFARNQENTEQQWIATGEAVIKITKEWTQQSQWNFSNKLYLLEAEYYFFKSDEAKAAAKYNAAIKAAHAHRFLHEAGLANMLAARFHFHYKRQNESLLYYTQARTCYERWGALALVSRVDAEIVVLKSILRDNDTRTQANC